MRKIACFTIAMLLVTCQLALAETVYYCVPNTHFRVTESGGAAFNHPRFKMKIGRDGRNVRVVWIESAQFFGLSGLRQEYRVADYLDDQMWVVNQPALNAAGNTHIFHFKYPNLFASFTRSNYGALVHATCETF